MHTIRSCNKTLLTVAFRYKTKDPWNSLSLCVLSDLDMLQPVGGVGVAGQCEVVSGSHPGLKALQLRGGSISGHMIHQVALELV